MFNSLSEFKFYQSFRIPVSASDDLRFLVEITDNLGKTRYIEDAHLIDISMTGFGFSTNERLSVATGLNISLHFKRMHVDITGSVVRAFSDLDSDEGIIYGVEIDHEPKLKRFLETYIHSFSSERLKDCLAISALRESYVKPSEGLEIFSLILSLFQDITQFSGNEGFLENIMEEMVRIVNAQRATIFLINPETNELEAVQAMGIEKEKLKFDYRLGIAGSVFTTGVALNIDVVNDKTRFNDQFDKNSEFETKSIICYPIQNREDKIIGVLEVLNKRSQDRFTVEDEKTMKIFALVFSFIYHHYTPISENSKIRRFSKPFDREYALIGKTTHINSLRRTIVKIKDLDAPVLIQGEKGVGKALLARIIHFEGRRGLKNFETVDCGMKDKDKLWSLLFDPNESMFIKCIGGTTFLSEIDLLPENFQDELAKTLTERGIEGSKFSIDVRILASTTEDLGKSVDDRTFNVELFKHLRSSLVLLEPLRRRSEDVEELASYFLKMECQNQGLLFKSFSEDALKKMKQYDWPLNVAELKGLCERAVLYNPKTHILGVSDITQETAPLFDVNAKRRVFGDIQHASDHSKPLKERLALVEREMILAEIKRNNGNKSKAAKEMGISREALRKKLLFSDKVINEFSETKADDKKAA